MAERRNAGLPDGGLDPMSDVQRLAVVRVLRELRPRLLLLPWHEVRHPDHLHACRLGEITHVVFTGRHNSGDEHRVVTMLLQSFA